VGPVAPISKVVGSDMARHRMGEDVRAESPISEWRFSKMEKSTCLYA